MAERAVYRVLLLGDFAYGESYPNAGARIVSERGYEAPTERIKPFIQSADSFLLNLETPVATEADYPSPFADDKQWVHWADPSQTPPALAKLGVDAVALANNHTFDLGRNGLLATFKNLRNAGIPYFGAGEDRDEAERPFVIQLPEAVGGGEIAFYSAFQWSKRADEKFEAFAKAHQAGSARISSNNVPRPTDYQSRPDTLNVAFPHWGPNYKWKTDRQVAIAENLVNNGYDLVIGHGSHAMQEIEYVSGKPVIYSIGNGTFLSSGRWAKYERETGIMPFSFWTVLEVENDSSGERRIRVKLYPVDSNNRKTDFCAGPVSESDFARAVGALRNRASRDTVPFDIGRDGLGRHLSFNVASWSPGQAPMPVVYPPGTGSESWFASVEGPGVQRVGYRKWLQSIALSRGVDGWVRNYGSDSVRCVLKGSPAAIREVIAQLHEGPESAEVSRVNLRRSTKVPRSGFRIRSSATTQAAATRRPARPESSGATLREIGDAIGGQWTGNPELDTRVYEGNFRLNRVPADSLFFVMDPISLQSKKWRRSTRQLDLTIPEIVKRAAARGALAAVATEPVPGAEIPVLVVDEARLAMFRFARWVRDRYDGTLVGVTGTVGKSTTTSLLSHVLAGTKDVHRTDSNWNTAVGVANTLNGTLRGPEATVIEVAISSFVRVPEHSAGEVVRPDIAIVTAIGAAHRDVAPTIEDTARIKGQIVANLRPGGTAVLTADTSQLQQLRDFAVEAGAGDVRTFGRADESDYRLDDWDLTASGMRVKATVEGAQLEYEMTSAGEGMALNSLGVLAASRAAGLGIDEAVSRIASYQANVHVSEVHELSVEGGTALVIDDSTNATVMSMRAAFQLLGKMSKQRGGRAVAALGQINYLWEQASGLHASLAQPLKEAGVELVLTTGNDMEQLRAELGDELCGSHADTPEELVDDLRGVLRPNDVLLIKGSSVDTGFRSVATALLNGK